MKRFGLWFVTVVSLILVCTANISAEDTAFRFTLLVDGQSEKQVSPGDVVTVIFTLERTDTADPFLMHAMQNEIRYDSTFFELVEDSFFTKDGIVTNDFRLHAYERELYMNYLSLSGGVKWNAKTNIGSFQMRVIGTEGAGCISSRDCSVSLPGGSGSYPFVTSDVVLVVSENCPVHFDSAGGSYVPSQTVSRRGTAAEPAPPVRNGYTFTGWYTDPECTEKWDFSRAVEANLRLYAGWQAGESIPDSLPFTDVSETDWFYDSVRYVYEHGLMNGVTASSFSPDTAASRAMLVTILWRMAGEPAVQYRMEFADVLPDQWYTEAIRWAASAGIVTGYSASEFGVNDSITREQMAVILYRYADAAQQSAAPGADLTSFRDADRISTWASDALRWAVGGGLIQGTGDNTLSPQETATRAQTAAILMRFCNLAV